MSGKRKEQLKVTVLGCRGSVPVSSEETRIYGGSTSSYRVDTGSEIIYLDAGSGLSAERLKKGTEVTILLSHWHTDHLVGLGMFLQANDVKAEIYGPAANDAEAEELLDRLYSPPLWPVRMGSLGAKVKALPGTMKLGDAIVTTAEGDHPNGCRIIRIDCRGRSLVYATDFEPDELSEERLVKISEGADLLMYDGQYTRAEAKKFRGFGHSTAEKGLEIKKKSGAGRLVLIHHGAGRTDAQLDRMEAEIRAKDTEAWFARQGDELFSINHEGVKASSIEEIEKLNESLEKRNLFIRRTFGRYLTEEVVQRLLDTEGGADIGGRKKKVSMMFTDLRGSTEISESMDPVDFIDMLNHYLAEMILIIDSWQGTILEFEGDAIVIVWGAPADNDTAAWQAASCAIALQNRMARVNEWNREQGYPELHMGIGIHTGDAILGNIGSSIRTKYDMIGRNVNLTARIQSYALGGQILVSEEMKEELEGSIVVNEAGTLSVKPKGISEEVKLYDMTGCGNLKLKR